MYFFVLCLRVRRIRVQEELNNALIRSVLGNDIVEKVLGTRRQLIRKLGRRYEQYPSFWSSN